MDLGRVDILEGNFPDVVLEQLLRDHTTQRNIFWATNDYEQWGDRNQKIERLIKD